MPNTWISPIQNDEFDTWVQLRHALWSDHTKEALSRELDKLLENPTFEGLIAWHGGVAVGFIEYQERSHAHGTIAGPVLYIEGLYVKPEMRKNGIGKLLMDEIKIIAKQRNYTAIASDARIENDISIQAHISYGFKDEGVLQHFLMEL